MNPIKTNKKATLIILGLLISILIFTGCASSSSIPADAVAVVNGNSISLEDFNKTVALQKMNYESVYGPDILTQDVGTGMTLLESMKRSILENLILEELIIQEAEKNNIVVTDEEIEESYDEYLTYQQNNAEFKQFTEEHGMDEAYIKGQIRRDILAHRYRDFFIEELNIDESAARAFYEENIDFFHVEEVTAKHILVRGDREKAEEILAQINDSGDFHDIADYYEEAGEENIIVEDLGSFGRGQMVTEFEEAVFSMEIGEVRGIVETDFGYHIVLVEDTIDETYSFEDMKQYIITNLGNADFQNHIEDLVNEATIERKEDL